jgi:ABC-type uncharacterized transport system involved in gliding motility auxiliary subunit/ABC-type transport system involved in multi-copper enzyme maturation permease subunit
MTAIWTIARRELRALFDLPTAYILLVVFVGVNDFLFFRQSELYGVATLRPMLDLLPWVLLFLVPAVTMRALAEDTRSGVIEIVLAQPITELQLLLGKYLGQLLFLLIALALTLPVPLGLRLGAHLQWGVIVAQYVGAALLLVGLTGVGVWASSVTRNQITAFIVAVTVMFLLILVGLDPLLVGLPPRLGAGAAALGVLSHFTGIARGVIDSRDAVYFLSLAAVFLVLAYFAIMRRKLTPHGDTIRRLRLGVALLTAGLVILNLFGRRITGRLDLTPGHAYTLSPATRQLLGSLNDLVTLKLFASAALPPEVAFLKRDVDDLLHDYRSAGRSKIRLVVEDPVADSAAAREARMLGIPPVQFNVVGRGELQVKEGYLGIAVQYAEGVKTIPFVRQSNDLEYRLTSDIRGLTRKDKPAVGLAITPDRSAAARNRTFNTMQEQLEQNYAVRPVALADSALPSDLKTLIIVGVPDSLPQAQMARLQTFLDSGSLLLMANGMNLLADAPLATARAVPWNALLRPYGVSVRSDMVYDLASNVQVAMPTQFGQVQMPYPLWVRALSTRASTVNAELDAVLLPWASTIDTSQAPPGTVTPLFVTSRAAGVRATEMLLNPTQQFSRDSLARRVLAVQVNGAAKGGSPAAHGRVIVVGSTDFASDRYFRGGDASVVFVQNAVDWLAQDEALIAIRSKDRSPPPLVFTSSATRDAVKYGNVIGIPILVIALGAVRLWRRRRLTREVYRPHAQAPAA